MWGTKALIYRSRTLHLKGVWLDVVFILILCGMCFHVCVMTTEVRLLCYGTQHVPVWCMMKYEGQVCSFMVVSMLVALHMQVSL